MAKRGAPAWQTDRPAGAGKATKAAAVLLLQDTTLTDQHTRGMEPATGLVHRNGGH